MLEKTKMDNLLKYKVCLWSNQDENLFKTERERLSPRLAKSHGLWLDTTLITQSTNRLFRECEHMPPVWSGANIAVFIVHLAVWSFTFHMLFWNLCFIVKFCYFIFVCNFIQDQCRGWKILSAETKIHYFMYEVPEC